VPSSPYRVCAVEFVHFRRKNVQSVPVRFLRLARVSFSASFQRLRNSCVACLLRLSMSRTRAMCSSSLPVAERTRLPSFLEQTQVVGALVVARLAHALDRVAGAVIFSRLSVKVALKFQQVGRTPVAISVQLCTTESD
jgi:hypothetical protein